MTAPNHIVWTQWPDFEPSDMVISDRVLYESDESDEGRDEEELPTTSTSSSLDRQLGKRRSPR